MSRCYRQRKTAAAGKGVVGDETDNLTMLGMLRLDMIG